MPEIIRGNQRLHARFRFRSHVLVFLAAVLLGGLVLVPAAGASTPARLTFTLARVASPGNPSVSVVPFQDEVYSSCSVAPQTKAGCLSVGSVPYTYGIGELEVTVSQWVAFLNTVDPTGADPHHLYSSNESASAWPRYGQINFSSQARNGSHYRIAYPEWADKPFGFATFLRAARFINAVTNGKVLSRRARRAGAFSFVTYTVRLSRNTETGMYNLAHQKRTGATRARKRGFVVPSQNEWIKAAYFDPTGGGTLSYWEYPTNPGTFGDGTASAPSATTLNPHNGNVTNAATTQPLANFKPSSGTVPSWCPYQVSANTCATVNPFGLSPSAYAKAFQGSLSSVGQARTRSPWGTLDQGGNAVEWTDTITAPPFGVQGKRVWRRLHGGVPNSTAYQMWISAVGLQPQDNTFFVHTYPWLGFRIGYIG
jgi:hypothetical protein